MRWIIYCLCIFLIKAPAYAQDRYYVEASRNAIVHEDPDADSRDLMRLQDGEQLNAVTHQ
jgi:hypothetical protein